MAVALADLSQRAGIPVGASSTTIRVLVVHECPLFRVGLCSYLAQQSDCQFIGQATHLEDVLTLARQQCPDIVLLDGGLTSADPLDLVQQLRQAGVPGIVVFASPTANEETLFRFLMRGATAYEDGFLSGEELLAKMHRVALGECLVTGEVLVAQAARRERLAHIRQDALLAARLAETCPPSPLTEQERVTLEQIARGGTNVQVAQALGVNSHAVKNHLHQVYRKLHVYDRTSAVVMALREQWITL